MRCPSPLRSTPSEDRFIVHTPDPGGDITVLLTWPSLLP
jgi:hypothetical protein